MSLCTTFVKGANKGGFYTTSKGYGRHYVALLCIIVIRKKTNEWMDELVGWWVGGLVGWWVGGLAGWRVGELAG